MDIARQLGVDAVIVSSATNRRYLTGFTASDHAPDESSGVVIVTASERLLFTSPTNLPWAVSEARDSVEVLSATRPWTHGVAAKLLERGFQRVGFEDATLTVRDHAALVKDLDSSIALVSIGNGVDRLRAVKQPQELESIESALQLTDVAFERSSRQLQATMTEHDLAEMIRAELRNVGSQGEAFPTIVASGPNAAKPHHVPGGRGIEEGEPVIIDMGARVDGYCGDLTRTIWVGQPSDRLVTMYRLVLDAQAAAIAAVRSGTPAQRVDQAARDVFDAAGMGKYVIHGVGHGLGLRIHEAPSVSQTTDESLETGHVITIEPGLYVEGWGGVRIEDVLLVEESGSRNLTKAAKRSP